MFKLKRANAKMSANVLTNIVSELTGESFIDYAFNKLKADGKITDSSLIEFTFSNCRSEDSIMNIILKDIDPALISSYQVHHEFDVIGNESIEIKLNLYLKKYIKYIYKAYNISIRDCDVYIENNMITIKKKK